jgi:GntR family transcriptional regulator
MTQLAEQYDLSVATVQRTMRLLIDDGMIFTVPGRGTFVVPEDQRPAR